MSPGMVQMNAQQMAPSEYGRGPDRCRAEIRAMSPGMVQMNAQQMAPSEYGRGPDR